MYTGSYKGSMNIFRDPGPNESEGVNGYTLLGDIKPPEQDYTTKFDIIIQNGELLRHILDMFKKFMAETVTLRFDEKGITSVQTDPDKRNIFQLKLKGRGMMRYDFVGVPVCMSISIQAFIKAMASSKKKNWIQLEYSGNPLSSKNELLVNIMSENSMVDMAHKSLLSVIPAMIASISGDYSKGITPLCRIQKEQFAVMCKKAKDVQDISIELQPPHYLKVSGRVDSTFGMRCEKGQPDTEKDVFRGSLDSETLKNMEKLAGLCHYFISMGFKENSDVIVINALIDALGSLTIYMKANIS